MFSIEIAESFKSDTALPTNTIIFEGDDIFETARIMEYTKNVCTKRRLLV